MRTGRLALIFAMTSIASVAVAEPFGTLRKAYSDKNADLAASAYSPDAEVIYRYNGTPKEVFRGREAIAVSFDTLFKQFDSAQAVDLNFRVLENSNEVRSGVYRLKVGRDFVTYGRFSTALGSDGNFSYDESSDATLAEFEDAAGPPMFAAQEEVLDRAYYSQLAGRYRLPDGCDLVVTRSQVRLFVRNNCTQQWRGLSRISGKVWTAGDRVLSDKVSATYRFETNDGLVRSSLQVETAAGTVMAAKQSGYITQDITFRSADGTKLSGTLYLPTGAKEKRPASVMIHGSGAQDRDGYASIIAVLADELATSGRVVLAYDKRGSGNSDGDGDRAGFDILADDAAAAMSALRTRADVDTARIGLAGSSQAGWVAAKAIEQGAMPADVLLLGAAGSAMTVSEQNLYNTDVLMGCAGIAKTDVNLALNQQTAFFAFLNNPKKAKVLDQLTAQGAKRPVLSDWLFPNSRNTDRSAAAWYVALDLSFDPLPVWRRYTGRAVFVFAEHDDATPTAIAMKRLRRTSAKSLLIPKAQHLGLLANDKCQAGFEEISAFSPAVMKAVAEFAM